MKSLLDTGFENHQVFLDWINVVLEHGKPTPRMLQLCRWLDLIIQAREISTSVAQRAANNSELEQAVVSRRARNRMLYNECVLAASLRRA
jgi:hypothetical protein